MQCFHVAPSSDLPTARGPPPPRQLTFDLCRRGWTGPSEWPRPQCRGSRHSVRQGRGLTRAGGVSPGLPPAEGEPRARHQTPCARARSGRRCVLSPTGCWMSGLPACSGSSPAARKGGRGCKAPSVSSSGGALLPGLRSGLAHGGGGAGGPTRPPPLSPGAWCPPHGLPGEEPRRGGIGRDPHQAAGSGVGFGSCLGKTCLLQRLRDSVRFDF